jgi:hypothetical protein
MDTKTILVGQGGRDGSAMESEGREDLEVCLKSGSTSWV